MTRANRGTQSSFFVQKPSKAKGRRGASKSFGHQRKTIVANKGSCRLFRIRFNRINRPKVRSRNPDLTSKQTGEILRQLWMTSKERKEALRATSEEIEKVKAENLTVIASTKRDGGWFSLFTKQFKFINRPGVAAANPNASAKEINSILARMWTLSKEREDAYHATEDDIEKVKASNLAAVAAIQMNGGEPHRVFKHRFYNLHRATVEAVNRNAQPNEINEMLKLMWKTSTDRQEAFKATHSDIEAAREDLNRSAFQNHIYDSFVEKHRQRILTTSPGISTKRLNKTLQQLWDDSNEKKWGLSRVVVDNTLNIEASDDSDVDG